jgi:hypothetical protein
MRKLPSIALAAGCALVRDAKCATQTTMQRRDAIKSARALVVLSSDRWTKVLVRRKAHAFESFAGMAEGGIRATRSNGKVTGIITQWLGNPLDAQARALKDADTFEARWRERVDTQ